MTELNPVERQPSEIQLVLEEYAQDVELVDRYYDIPIVQSDLDKKKQFFLTYQKTLDGLDFDAMSQSERIDYFLFKTKLEYELRQLLYEERRNREIAQWVPFYETIARFESQRRQLEAIDSSTVAARLASLPQQIIDLRQSLEKPNDAEGVSGERLTLAHRAAKMVDELRKILQRWYDFYNGYDPVFTWWVNDPYQEADIAIQEYASFLREDIIGMKEEADAPIIGDAIGREALLNELANAMIPYSPEELIAIGRTEFAWCKQEMTRASHALGYGDNWQQALEHVKQAHVAPGEQPRLIQELALEAINFLEEHDLVTIPPLARQMWRMSMMSPERQKETPFFTGGEVISVSFPTDSMPHEQKLMSMRGNNKHFARATVQHELIPGHHLQGFMARRHRQYRRVFATPFFVEGWALHWEMLLWNLEFAVKPEDRIGMLFWRLHRCARIIFSLGFHLGEMTPEECIDMLVDQVGHEKANAIAEVRRSFEGSYPPLYQCAYMIGGLQIRALHKELVASGKMTHREFHDALLRENAIPVEMIRASLTNQELHRDFSSSWKFAGAS